MKQSLIPRLGRLAGVLRLSTEFVLLVGGVGLAIAFFRAPLVQPRRSTAWEKSRSF
jgi:hypothetical protein